MKHIYVRPAHEGDVPKAQAWLEAASEFDRDAVQYPKSFLMAAYDHTGAVAYMPVQRVFMMETIGFRPELSDADKAIAMKEFTQFLVTQSHVEGQGEVYFLGTNEGTNKYATHQCYEELPWKVYRLKLKRLEP